MDLAFSVAEYPGASDVVALNPQNPGGDESLVLPAIINVHRCPIDDPGLYLPQEELFRGIQDAGVDLWSAVPSHDHEKYHTDKKKSKRKHIRLGDKLYSGLYLLADKIYMEIVLPKKEDIFKKLTRNQNEAVKKIGLSIVVCCQVVSHGDLHSSVSIDATQKDLAERHVDFCKEKCICFFAQRELFQVLLDRWASNKADFKRTTDDDRVRLFGILFTKDFCEYIPYFVSNTLPTGWMELDARRGRRNGALRRLFCAFTDKEVFVHIPEI